MSTIDVDPPENHAGVIDRLKSLRSQILDGHDFSVQAFEDFRAIASADWKAMPPEIIKEMFERSSRLHAARLQALFGMVEAIIDQVDFGRADDFVGDEDD